MLAVMTMEIDASVDLLGDAGQATHGMWIDLVISDRDVDVAKPNAFGQLNLGYRGINANNRFDALLLESREVRFRRRLGSGHQPVTNRKHIVELTLLA